MMGSVAPVFTPLAATEHEAVAELLHRALVGWYETRLGQGSRFGDRSEPFRLIPKVYAALDPGEAIAAREANGGALLGVCFVHPRPTHLSVGIVAVAPEAQGRGIARGLLTRALARADELRVPARLVSSLLNLDSYSLYTRHGFVPEEVYPARWNHAMLRDPTHTPDQHDAACVAAALAEADRSGELESLFKPKLTRSEQAQAAYEGWILGVQP